MDKVSVVLLDTLLMPATVPFDFLSVELTLIALVFD
jgi:hypothetical protein